ncbi:MAG: hypothetical protein HGA44_08710 [Cellulomonadaceae bacterium]|nr:hypothetical protein [Cellulomonadaceae bacterium]
MRPRLGAPDARQHAPVQPHQVAVSSVEFYWLDWVAGDEVLTAGDGDDVIEVGSGNDRAYAGGGSRTSWGSPCCRATTSGPADPVRGAL